MTINKLINTILLFVVLGSNVWADSKAIYDSKTKTLSLEGILVPFIDEFTGKETDNKGIFDVQLEEKTKLVFELIPWSINFKNTFDGKNTNGYILYDHKTRSVKIPCFEVTTIAKFGDGIEGETIYYKDVNMKQRHVNYPIFHVEDMTKTDSCESSVIPEPKKPTLTTTPTTTQDDTVEIEVNGKVGTAVFVNGVDSGKTIDSTGKVKVILDTSGDDGEKSFSITLKDDKGNESDVLIFTISKNQVQRPFITVWQTTENDKNITIPIDTNFDYDYTVNWGDGTIENFQDESATHTYDSEGNWSVKIKGNFPALIISNDVWFSTNQEKANAKQLLKVTQWGNIKWKSMKNMFAFCENFELNATDTPNLSQVTDMSYMFYYAKNFNQPLNSWNISNVTNTKGMFYYAEKFNQSLNSWNVFNVTNMRSMFNNAINFNQPLNNWDVSNVTDMKNMFYSAINFNQPLNNWDVSNVIGMTGIFYHAKAFNQDISNWNVSNVTYMSSMFKDSNLSTTNYDNLLNKWSKLSLKNNVTFGVGNTQYSQDANSSRQSIIDNFNWTITDGGMVDNSSQIDDTILIPYKNARDLILSKDETKAFIVNEYYDSNLTQEILNLSILDVKNLNDIKEISQFQLNLQGGMPTKGLTLSNDETKIFMSYGGMGDIGTGFMIIDITNLANPIEISRFNGSSNAGVTALSNDNTKVFFANYCTGLKIIDIEDLTNLKQISNFDSPCVKTIVLSKDNKKAYIHDDYNRLIVLDITNPLIPTKISELNKSDGNNGTTDITLSKDETKAYITDYANGLTIVDLTKIMNPIEINSYKVNGNAYGVTLSKDEKKAYVVYSKSYTKSGIIALDISDSNNLIEIHNYDIESYTQGKLIISNDNSKGFFTTNKGLMIIKLKE